MFSTAYHIEMVWSTHKGNSLATMIYKMLGRLLSRYISICNHIRKVILQTRTRKENKGYTHILHLYEVREIGCLLRQTGDDALYMHIYKTVDYQFLIMFRLVRITTEYRIALRPCVILYTIEHRRIIVGYEVGQYHTNNTWCLFAKTLCERIGTIVKFLCQLLYLISHILSNFMAISQCSGYGCNADTKFTGKVFQ